MKHLKRRTLPVLLALTLLLGTGAAVATAGDKKDPLVTLSYLQETVIPEIMDWLTDKTESVEEDLRADFDDQIEEYEKEMLGMIGDSSAGSDTFVLVTLTSGQSMALDVGCELMLRVGTAAVNAATSPALIDMTTGDNVAPAASLTRNHLYMATIPDRTLTPTAETVKLLVRGGYTVS